MSSHPRFLLPSEFDAEAIVGPLKADAARWLVSTVLGKTAANNVDARGFAILSSVIIRRVMGRDYAKIVRSLIDAGVLLRAPYHEGKSYGYRLADEYLSQRPTWMPVRNPEILSRIQRERQRYGAEQAALRLPIHEALNRAQRSLDILPEARAAVEQLPAKSRLCQHVHVDRIERRDFRLTISTTGRLFNGLSGVKRELRRLIHLDGSPIGCVDICNSQPAILGNLLAHGIPPQWAKRVHNIKHYGLSSLSCPCLPPPLSPFSPPVVDFVEIATSGVLYDSLAASAGLSRPFVKKRFLVDVLAKKWRYPSEVERVFRERFPDVWEWIQTVNGIPGRRPKDPKHRSKAKHSPNRTANLIRLLQRVESLLVVETLSPDLVKRIPIVTLHDAIFSRQQDLEEVEEAFDKVLEDIGWKLALKPGV